MCPAPQFLDELSPGPQKDLQLDTFQGTAGLSSSSAALVQ